MRKRASGILLHITSLPSPFEIGDFGPGAYRFIDFLAESKQSFWQVLPFSPTDLLFGNSPYNSFSLFAGNPLFISPSILVKEGLLLEKDVASLPPFPKEKCNYPLAFSYKRRLLNEAWENFKRKKQAKDEFGKFCQKNASWLDDFSLFIALKSYFNKASWNKWPSEFRDREPCALNFLKNKLDQDIQREKFFQFLFFKQWFSLKKYCSLKRIRIIGDLPIYPTCDSVDVWANPEIFKLDKEKRPVFVAGVPPDYFSNTGQLWGNPVYKWDVLKEQKYRWWINRIRHSLCLFDIVRIDHFRGFVSFWEVPAGEKTAMAGRWIEVPAEDFFKTISKEFPHLPFIAEDLGFITPDVEYIMQKFNIPGMKILLFAFGEDTARHPYAPHNYVRNCVVYTGTHDTNTARGWFEEEASSEEKERLFHYIGREISPGEVSKEFIRLAMMSVADLSILPMQDVLGLGSKARMNTPSTSKGNWEWRLSLEQMKDEVSFHLRGLTRIYGRCLK